MGVTDFGYQIKLCLGGSDTTFRRYFFCLAEPKNFAGEPFFGVFHKTSGSEKVFGKKRGGCQYFRSKKFWLTVLKKFVDEPLSVSLISGIEKVYASDGFVTIFRRSFFLSRSTEKSCRGNLLCCVSEKFP